MENKGRITSYNVCYTKLLRGDVEREENAVVLANLNSILTQEKK